MCSGLLNALRKCILNYSEAVCLARSMHKAPTLIPRSQELKAGEGSCRKAEGCEHTLAAAGVVFWLCLAVARGETPLPSVGCCAAMLRWIPPTRHPDPFFGRPAPLVAAKSE